LLGLWEASAAAILRAVRRFPGRAVLVSWEEACADGAGFSTVLRERFGLEGFSPDIRPRELDPVGCALAIWQVRERGASLAVALEELHATSLPLGSADDLPAQKDAPVLAGAWSGMLAARRQAEENTHLSAEVRKISGELALAKQESETIKGALKAERQTAAKSESRYEQVSRDLAAAKEESELLLLQLHQVQEELEHYFLECRRLQKQLEERPKIAPFFLEANGVEIGHIEPRAPHRHAGFELLGARLAGRELGRVDMRLVEHHGRPGVAVFRARDEKISPPLFHWKSHGVEAGREYMLLVCEDPVGREFFTAATTSDLMLCREGVRLFASSLALEKGKDPEEIKRWQRVARRFFELLDDLPLRMHYDHVEAVAPAGDVWEFTLHQAWLPRRYRRSLTVLWGSKKIALKLMPGEAPSLANWPIDEQGKPLAEFVLDRSSPEAARRAAWQKLTTLDRAWVTSIVAELPNVLHHIRQQHPASNADFDARLAGARQHQADLKALGKKPARHILARLLGKSS
jgi:hypothetical protein